MQVLGDWKKRDEELDVKLGDLNILLDEIKMQVEQQGDVKTIYFYFNLQQMKVVAEMTNKATEEVGKANTKLKTENDKLKELVKTYRAPSKCCLDITMILFILGLIAIIVMLFKK